MNCWHYQYLYYLIIIFGNTERMFSLLVLIAYWNITVTSHQEQEQNQAEYFLWRNIQRYAATHSSTQQLVDHSQEIEGASHILSLKQLLSQISQV